MSRKVIELASRWYVFVFLNVYGLGKITGGQFYRRGRLPEDVAATTLADAAAFDLAWTFMGYSFAYILFIGLAEVVGAWLLLWERTKLLGVLILLPIMINIVVFDVIFLDKYGALMSAIIYTVLLFVILLLDRDAVSAAIRALTSAGDGEEKPFRQRAKIAGLALAAMALLFAFDQFLVNLLGH